MTQMQDPSIQRAMGWLQRDMDRTKAWDLSKYAAGTFTPIFQATGTPGTFTYSAQLGVYARFENVVAVRGRVTITAISVAPTGEMRIAALPFTSLTGQGMPLAMSYSQLDLNAACIQLGLRVQSAASVAIFVETRDGLAEVNYPASQFTNAAADVQFCGVYFI